MSVPLRSLHTFGWRSKPEQIYPGGDIAARETALTDDAFTVRDHPGLDVEPDEPPIARHKVSAIEVAYLKTARPDWFPFKRAF